ncbi:MAG: alpha-galactosidase [Oscillospiraceae bacterium]|jgi:alpha-galactosidase|nr:alpha-galactosidase [Oscillospiraceae bacterium]
MPITYNERSKSFLLHAGSASYAMQISPEGYLYHLHFGGHISETEPDLHAELGGGASFSANIPEAPDQIQYTSMSLDTALQEYPGCGVSDYRVPAVAACAANGARAVCLKYVSHEVLPGQKPGLPGLPATYFNEAADGDTLVILMEDALLGLQVKLYYTVFAGLNIVTRWAVAENTGSETLAIESLQSACVEFPSMNYDMIGLHGAWGRERSPERVALRHGTQSLQSRRGATGHQLNPFMALCAKNADENQGDVFGFSLVYSGNFRIETEVSQMHTARVALGVNPDGFCWQLRPGETFASPEAVLSYSSEGLGGISRALHRLYRNNLIRGEWKRKPCPILINSWEAAYFDFDAEKLVHFAAAAAKAGVELLVMDDGWFGKRDDDTSSLGDWSVNEAKLGCSLPELVERVKAEGLQFGIWFEPEMISPNSELYRTHPDWALHIPGRGRSLGRNQCVLNLTLPEVRENLYQQISAVLRSCDIVYLKWDFNRNLTEVFSAAFPAQQQGEVSHRYLLGLYELMERLVEEFPHILYESCSGGGGRFDPGMLYYMPQTWASDNTDPADRLRIQYGTSICYPVASMGAHVSKIPERGRVTSLQYRADVATCGTFGYELDPTKLPPEDLSQMREINSRFKQLQPLVREGDFYRLRSPFEGQSAAWMVVSPDRSEALVQCFTVLAEQNSWDMRIYPRGLDPDAVYEIEEWAIELHGDTIMNAGLRMVWFGGDFASRNLHLVKV